MSQRLGGDSVSDVVRVQVLMKQAEAARFERYCADRGHKKSTLIVRLVREHLEREGYVHSSSVQVGMVR
jgi:hypothetical protein